MAAPTRVQTTGWQPSGGAAPASDASALTMNLTVTAGNTVVVGIFGYTAARTFTTTDDRGGSYTTSSNSFTSSGGYYTQLDFAQSHPGGTTTFTITSNPSAGAFWAIATEVRPTNGVSQAPAGYEDTGSNSHQMTATATAMGTDVYIFGIGRNLSWANFVTKNGSFVLVDSKDTESAGAGSYELIAQDWSTSGNQTTDGAWTSDNSRPAVSLMVSFAPSVTNIYNDGAIIFRAAH